MTSSKQINVTFFKTPTAFRKWLKKNHSKETELLVGYYKVGSGKPSINWSQSVDQALCFGWIDGVRKSLGDESYCIRFTPRKTRSIWSAINIKKIEELTKRDLMQPAGLKSFKKMKGHRSNIYAYENDEMDLSSEFELKFKTNKIAWDFFRKQAPSYRKRMTYRIMTAKRVETQLSRLEELIGKSADLKRVN